MAKNHRKRELKFDSGILPPYRNAYNFGEMKRGESFTVKPENVERTRNAAYAYMRRLNAKNATDPSFRPVVFSCERMSAKVWRVFRKE